MHPRHRPLLTTLRACLAAMACLWAGLPAWAALAVVDRIEHLPGVMPVEDCNWQAGAISAAVGSSQGAITPAGQPGARPPLTLALALQVAQVSVSHGPKKTGYRTVLRGQVTSDGKLLATRDFQDERSVDNAKPSCDTLRAVAAELGESMAN